MIKSTVDLTSNRDFGINGIRYDFRNMHIDFKKRRNIFEGLFNFLQDNSDVNYKNFWLVERIQQARDFYYDVNNHCHCCGKDLSKAPWLRDGELCKQCSQKQSYPKGWTYQKNNGWIDLNLDNNRIPFASWF